MRQAKSALAFSGWTYKSWRGRFYPEGLPHKRELAHIGSIFPTVEINGTFYSMQRPESFGRWAELTPDDFVFAVKGPRFLTHMKRLSEPVAPLGNFLASGVSASAQAGPILWQLPPNFRFNPDKLEAFFRLLPRDTSGGGLWPPARPSAEGACLAADGPRRSGCATPSKSATRAFAIRLHRSPAPARHRPGLRRHGRLAAADGSHGRLRLLPPARLARALSQRLQRGRARPLGAAHPRLARRQADARRHLRRRAGARPCRATSTSTSTTPTSSWRRVTPGR